MILKKWVASVATATMLGFALLSTPAISQSNSGFSGLQGVDVQPLSVQEMQAISGELNAVDIANALWTYATTKLTAGSKLYVSTLKLAQWYYDNRVSVNNLFAKYNQLTTCVSGGHYNC